MIAPYICGSIEWCTQHISSYSPTFLIYPPRSAFHSLVACLTIVITVGTEMTTSLYPPPIELYRSVRIEISLGTVSVNNCYLFLHNFPLTIFLILPSPISLPFSVQSSFSKTPVKLIQHPTPCSSHHNQIHFNTVTNRSQILIEEGQERSGGWQEEGKERAIKCQAVG